jgi:hypothetical protein
MTQALLDTSAVYALVDRRDKWHAAATAHARTWLSEGSHWLLSNFIFDEAVTLIKARIDARTAIQAGLRLRTAAAYEWLPLTADDEERAWAIFRQYADKDWSFTDCIVFALSIRLKVPVFTFDIHFKQMPGVEQVP